jgi:hypothetical protein
MIVVKQETSGVNDMNYLSGKYRSGHLKVVNEEHDEKSLLFQRTRQNQLK